MPFNHGKVNIESKFLYSSPREIARHEIHMWRKCCASYGMVRRVHTLCLTKVENTAFCWKLWWHPMGSLTGPHRPRRWNAVWHKVIWSKPRQSLGLLASKPVNNAGMNKYIWLVNMDVRHGSDHSCTEGSILLKGQESSGQRKHRMTWDMYSATEIVQVCFADVSPLLIHGEIDKANHRKRKTCSTLI